MCTISYISTGDSFFLTANRDEHISRAALRMETIKKDDGRLVYFPEDPVSKGSWISISSDGRVACLFNGAETKHEHNPPYRLSRGQILLSFFDSPSIEAYMDDTDLTDIEPFTIILIDRPTSQLVQMRWDGTQKLIDHLSFDGAYVWSSSTLYDPPLSKAKEENYFRMLDTNMTNLDKHILSLHGLMKYEDLLSERAHELIFSTSITQVTGTDRDLVIQMNSLVYEILLEARVTG